MAHDLDGQAVDEVQGRTYRPAWAPRAETRCNVGYLPQTAAIAGGSDYDTNGGSARTPRDDAGAA